MNKLNIFLLMVLISLLVFAKVDSAAQVDSDVATVPTVSPTPTLTPTPTPIPIGTPMTVSLPSIGVDNAPIDPVGVDDQGKMQMPSDWGKVGWFASGYKPGEVGNAVFGGHYDTIYGTKGWFFYLSNVNIGDEVIVNDSYGRQYHFRVIDKQVYEYDKVPLEHVFGEASSKNLNLITCTGWYSQVTHNYSHRIVVYTQMVE